MRTDASEDVGMILCRIVDVFVACGFDLDHDGSVTESLAFATVRARAFCAPPERDRLRFDSCAAGADAPAPSGRRTASGGSSKPPLHDATSRDAGLPTDGADPRPLRVYLVEDAPSFRDRLADYLTETGDVEMAGFADSEAAALQDLRGAPPDVVIVDLHLREGSGIGVIESLRRQWPRRPPTIVVLTNYAFPEFEAACRDRGADHFYDKSTQFGAVKTLLRSLRESGR